MNRDAPPAVPIDQGDAIARTLLVRKVQLHRDNLWMTHLGSMSAALALAVMLRGAVPDRALLAWLGLLAAVFAVRTVVGRIRPQGTNELALNRAWLLRLRIGFLAHGIAWGLCSVLPLPGNDPLHLGIMVIVMAGVMTSSFALTAFDLVAAVLFGVPLCGLLALRVFSNADPTYWMLGAAVLGVFVFLCVAAGRTHRVVRRYEALRLAEAAQADALRSSERLLERTGETAGVGGWELDLATQGLRLTTQAYRIHDVAPVAQPTLEGFISLYAPPEQAHMRAGLAQVVTHGSSYDHELPLTTEAV